MEPIGLSSVFRLPSFVLLHIIRLLAAAFQKNNCSGSIHQSARPLTFAIVRAYNSDFQQNFAAGKKLSSRQKPLT
jgi:chromate transport protein ChrA